MSFHHSPKIVTDNLALLYDVGNTKCYPGSGTTVTDRNPGTPKLDGVMTNANIYDSGNWDFHNTDTERITVAGSGSFTESQSFTVCAWYYPHTWDAGSTNTYQGVFNRTSGSTPNHQISCYIHADDAGASFEGKMGGWVYDAVNVSGVFSQGPQLILNEWNYCIWSFDYYDSTYGTMTLHLFNSAGYDSSYQDTLTKVRQLINNNTMTIGSYQNNLYRCDGFLNMVQYYNGKALTEAECYQNFNAMKGRFGL